MCDRNSGYGEYSRYGRCVLGMMDMVGIGGKFTKTGGAIYQNWG